MLMEAEPETFHFTAHYKDYPSVLARIATLHPGSFRNFLERRWRKIAPKTLVKERDAEQARPKWSASNPAAGGAPHPPPLPARPGSGSSILNRL